jgi:hypothetical protein
MRLVSVSALLAGVLVGSSAVDSNAFAQDVYHKWCLHNRGHVECAYDTLAQCNASRIGESGACRPNK